MHYRSFLEVRRNPFAGALFERIFEIFFGNQNDPGFVPDSDGRLSIRNGLDGVFNLLQLSFGIKGS